MARSKSLAEKAVRVERILELQYGRPENPKRFDPMEELVSCILSQHTSDANSIPAFHRLMERFGSWETLASARQEDIADSVRQSGLANQKAKSIRASLIEIHRRTGAYSLDILETMSLAEARRWLTSLPGVGPKTAAIVLCFAFGRKVVPVDTHVFRVCWRIGLFAKALGADRAHDVLLDLVSPEDAFAFHMLCIRHGREVCKAVRPLCERCALAPICDWRRSSFKLEPNR